ncbi:response to drug-related protein [Moniliophthora roreri MCA 2997]|uniref:Response to drug-related protein n=1 Tax=Moniliophthora roreri (strain MCA 2997) TaxID=1381753 RepID=V2WNW2_MONRO|nr:response to drug-related protein [Moniliophthora roreri MCA 2997]
MAESKKLKGVDVDTRSVHSEYSTNQHADDFGSDHTESTRTTSLQPQRLSTGASSSEHEHIAPFSASFTDRNLAVARMIYLRVLIGGTIAITVAMFSIFSIYWGALWKSPAHSLHGWIVDFDGSTIGNVVSQGVSASSSPKGITWEVVPPSAFPGGSSEIAAKLVDEKAWVAVVINSGVTDALNSAVRSADASYNGSTAVTVFGVEARNENAFRLIIRPTVQSVLESVSERFAQQQAQELASSLIVQAILSNAPQIITRPIGYTITNIRPFDIPVATAITFVGLIYLTILSFFIVMMGVSAREMSGLERHLTTGSLIRVRIASTFIAYFFLSLFYSCLSVGFQVDFDRRFGRAGFVIFWMLSYVAMLALGLALEAMVTLLTARGIPFFLLLWIITNVSVCFFPIEIQPRIYHYGYGTPFYNVNRAIRTILFSTKDNLGLNFGVLLAWVVISCITLPLFQWFMRRKHMSEINRSSEPDEKVRDD